MPTFVPNCIHILLARLPVNLYSSLRHSIPSLGLLSTAHNYGNLRTSQHKFYHHHHDQQQNFNGHKFFSTTTMTAALVGGAITATLAYQASDSNSLKGIFSLAE